MLHLCSLNKGILNVKADFDVLNFRLLKFFIKPSKTDLTESCRSQKLSYIPDMLQLEDIENL